MIEMSQFIFFNKFDFNSIDLNIKLFLVREFRYKNMNSNFQHVKLDKCAE